MHVHAGDQRYIVPEYFKFSGYLSLSENISFHVVPNGVGTSPRRPRLDERRHWPSRAPSSWYAQPHGELGNYGKGLPGLGPVGVSAPIEDPEKRAKLNGELANGRLAMVAIIGMIFHSQKGMAL